MRIAISDYSAEALYKLKDELLMSDNHLMVIEDLEIIEEDKRRLTIFGYENIKQKYVINISVVYYHPKGKFIGLLSNDKIKDLLLFYDLYKMREDWLNFKTELNAFGFDVIELERPIGHLIKGHIG